jgi:hypothetical protein
LAPAKKKASPRLEGLLILSLIRLRTYKKTHRITVDVLLKGICKNMPKIPNNREEYGVKFRWLEIPQ